MEPPGGALPWYSRADGPGRRGLTPIEIDRPTALGLLGFWREPYETIVVDGPGVRSAAEKFAASADDILLVTTNELAALNTTRRSFECLEHSAIDRARLKLIVNRYTPATGLKRDDVQTALKLALDALLEDDYKVVQTAVLEGKPVEPSSRFGRNVRELADRLTGLPKSNGGVAECSAGGLVAGPSPG